MDCYRNQCYQGYQPVMGPGPVIPQAGPMDDCSRYQVGMAYVPWQRWQQTYPIDQAMRQGTIFPDLDKPFLMWRCGA